MKYFIDTEFLEGTQKERFPINLFRKNTPNTIDLISIGIVAEDGGEFYAISKDFNLKEAWNRYEQGEQHRNGEWIKDYWIRENVIKPIYYELIGKDIDFHDYDRFFTYKAMKNLIAKKGKTNKEIAREIKEFVYKTSQINDPNLIENWEDVKHLFPLEFYAYYADYDWVTFCWLFGKMIDLPKGFPRYCRDLKQEWDNFSKSGKLVSLSDGEYHSSNVKNLSKDYPKQDPSKSHNALEDARWNKQLFKFINGL